MRGDAEALRRVVINLLGNAVDAIEQRAPAEPTIMVETGQNLAGSELWLRVRDNGTGIDAASSGDIFNPFYTSKEGGTGLGLAISKKLVEAHGGSIEVGTGVTDGSELVVSFPLTEAAATK